MASRTWVKNYGVAGPMRSLKLFFREATDYYRFFWKTKKASKEVVFYSEHEAYYPYFEGIIGELIGKHAQDICYITSDSNDAIFKCPRQEIKTFYLNKLLPLFMKFVGCKVFVMTLTDLNLFYLKRSIEPVHYLYMFHSLSSTHMTYRPGAFDHYDSILSCGPHQTKEIRSYEKLNNLNPKKIVEAGYYRLERIYKSYQENQYKRPSSERKKIVLIAPSWGNGNILETCGEKLIDILLGSGYKVILRPHPETIIQKPNFIKSLTTKFFNRPNFTFEASVATDTSLLKADTLITDFSGIALEYAFGTERPVLFIDTLPKVLNPRYKELDLEPLQISARHEIGIIVQSDNIYDVPEVVSRLIGNHESYKTKLAGLRDKYIYSFGHSSEIGARHIMDILGKSSGIK